MITCRLEQLNHFRFTNSLPVELQVIVGSVFISPVYSCNPRSFPHFLHWRTRRISHLRCRVGQKPAGRTLVVSGGACCEISDWWRWPAGDCPNPPITQNRRFWRPRGRNTFLLLIFPISPLPGHLKSSGKSGKREATWRWFARLRR